MQVTETLNSGLKREIKVTVPASDLEERLLKRLADVKDKVRINGFRPGKVPVQHLRKVYGKSFMAEVVNEILNNSTREIITGRGEKAAMQPEVKMTEDEKEADKILNGGADFEFELAYEVIPPIEIQDVSGIKVTRKVYDVPESEVEDQVKRIAESTRTFEAKDGKAEDGDRLTIDFLGRIDGEPFEGGKAEDQQLVLGSKSFIPGFEGQLVGAKAGDEKKVTVTFPEDYQAAHLAGKEAMFDVTVKEVAKPGALELNDETAKSLGLESIERLREIVKGQIESQYGQMTRQKVKRELLDALDGSYKFEAPSKLVEAEFGNIWTQVNRDLTNAGRTFADEETTEEDARGVHEAGRAAGPPRAGARRDRREGWRAGKRRRGAARALRRGAPGACRPAAAGLRVLSQQPVAGRQHPGAALRGKGRRPSARRHLRDRSVGHEGRADGRGRRDAGQGREGRREAEEEGGFQEEGGRQGRRRVIRVHPVKVTAAAFGRPFAFD